MSIRPAIVSPWTRTYKSLFALIIGINAYDSVEFPRLRSAVRDALAYRDYLTDYLGVPETQIRMLINRAASRSAILQAFESFKSDMRINVGDPIFIVYAGHGTQIIAPLGWETGGRHLIQALVPYDYCSTPGLEVPCIPDRTIGAMLEDIAQRKGNNITIVLDCCHSASGTRGASNKTRIRSVTLKPSHIHTQDLDQKIWDSGYKVLHPAPRFRFRGLNSHMLLAACNSTEHAGEHKGRHGKFSGALLKLLRSVPPDQLRYSQILSSMDPISDQNPQVEGVEQERFLFGIGNHAPLPPIYPLYFDQVSGHHFVNVGTAHGITQGSTFDLLLETNPEAIPIGSIVVVRSMPFYSLVAPDNDGLKSSSTHSNLLAVRRNAGRQKYQIRIYITPNDNYQASREYMCSLLEDRGYDLLNITLVDDPGEAQLEVSINHNNAMFQLLDKNVTQHGFHYRYPRIDAGNDNMASFLEGVANYYSELDRTSDDSELMNDIQVSCYRLEETPSAFNDISQMDMVPVGQDLCRNKEIDVVAKDDSCYGFKIVNYGSRDLYPTLLYFDSRDLGSITTWYKPPSSGPYVLEAPLKKLGGSLTVGYGNGGAPPVTYSLQEDQNLTVGFLKLVVFTRPVDFVDTIQRPYTSCIDPHPSTDTWSSLVIPIIQRRRPKQTPISPLYNWPNSPDPIERKIGAHCHAISRRTASMPNQFLFRSK